MAQGGGLQTALQTARTRTPRVRTYETAARPPIAPKLRGMTRREMVRPAGHEFV